MIQAVAALSDLHNSTAAGTAIAADITAGLGGAPADAIIVFASSQHNHAALLSAIHAHHPSAKLVGCSSAGEFSSHSAGVGAVSAIAFASDEVHFAVALGRGVRSNLDSVVEQIVSGFAGPTEHGYAYRTALVLADALAGYTDELVEKLNIATGGLYQFVGGGAGDDANFQSTHVFSGVHAYTDAAVALEILSNKPIGVGARHGWMPASAAMRVTEADGTRLVSLNGFPAAEVYRAHIEELGQAFDESHPLPHFLHHIIGIDTSRGHKLRVPLAVEADGALLCASDIPSGVLVHFMSIEAESAAQAASAAAHDAISQLGEHPIAAALFFDCVATRLRMGADFDNELNAVGRSLGTKIYGGCNTYGQIVRRDGQFNGFHNCTAVVCAFPR